MVDGFCVKIKCVDKKTFDSKMSFKLKPRPAICLVQAKTSASNMSANATVNKHLTMYINECTTFY